DAAGTEINWSEVARPSLAAAVADFEHRKGKNVSTAIERLRASKRRSDQQEKPVGYKDGRSWAENKAEYSELVRLQRRREDQPDESPQEAFTQSVDTRSARDVNTWPSSQYGTWPSSQYGRGFIEGALKFFSEVRAQVESDVPTEAEIPELAFNPA